MKIQMRKNMKQMTREFKQRGFAKRCKHLCKECGKMLYYKEYGKLCVYACPLCLVPIILRYDPNRV